MNFEVEYPVSGLCWCLVAFKRAWTDGKWAQKQKKTPAWPLRTEFFVENYKDLGSSSTPLLGHLRLGIRLGTAKWRSGAQSATTAGTSAPPEVRSTSGHTNHDLRSWFAPMKFFVCRERSIPFPFPRVQIFKWSAKRNNRRRVSAT